VVEEVPIVQPAVGAVSVPVGHAPAITWEEKKGRDGKASQPNRLVNDFIHSILYFKYLPWIHI
jgi:hypothetical protein